uniref:Uncharacterized protein n=1 Tax=Myotis myotis TaxID=51298 RepID=A0A7J7U5F4_MYOMY|nr:hypothetical protein mMyoMyo1_008849 [Myotis myotis]
MISFLLSACSHEASLDPEVFQATDFPWRTWGLRTYSSHGVLPGKHGGDDEIQVQEAGAWVKAPLSMPPSMLPLSSPYPHEEFKREKSSREVVHTKSKSSVLSFASLLQIINSHNLCCFCF